MGRLGPLTSMALGRSPYDDVVMGEGEGDPREPPQMYDERGRPVNSETKRINKDIIRSHNEVMLVIGVVESETSMEEMRAEQLRRYAHERDDERVARNLEWAARVCELAGVWGVGGMRQRILLYKNYSHVPFASLFHYERRIQPPSAYWLHGLPAFLTANISDFAWFEDRIMKSTFLKVAFSYIQTSLRIWIFLQRSNLLPVGASPWFPSWKYFIPGSSASAIPPCPLPPTLSLASVAGWLGRSLLGFVPFMAFWAVNGLWLSTGDLLYEEIYDMLPNPSNPEHTRVPGGGFILQRIATDRDVETTPTQPHAGSEAPVDSGDAGPVQVQTEQVTDSNTWDVSQNTEQATSDENGSSQQPPQERSATPAARAENPTAGPSRPRSHPRRSRAPDTDDFSSDEEATEEIVSATLISFDVENNPENPDPSNDNNMPPGGVWSAELRPNPGNDPMGGSDGHGRDGDGVRRPLKVFRDNALTQLPASIAAGVLARRISSVMLAPLEASAMRQIAWLWCLARGWPTETLWEPVWFWPLTLDRRARLGFSIDFGAGFSFHSLINFVGLEAIHLMVDACLWGYIPFVVSKHLISDEEWEKRRKQALQEQQGLEDGVIQSHNELTG